MRDIVYILKENVTTEELKYSLRSVEANFPHRYVWFVGGQPKGLTPDRALPHKQYGEMKWDLIRSSMLEVVKQDELSDEFFLFNDDFFVMQPFKGTFVNYADRKLKERIDDFHHESMFLNHYARTLVMAREELTAQGYSEINFEVHMPMLFEKSKIADTIMRCRSPQMRSVYGNITGCKYKMRDDVKVHSLTDIPDKMDFVSTSDKTFVNGAIGKYIRNAFPYPSRFETGEGVSHE